MNAVVEMGREARPASPLFIPLKAEYFQRFARGEKREEYRLLGSRWNKRTCYPGRPVVLSCGYGKSQRLRGRVTGAHVVHYPDWLPGFVACYGAGAGPALAIGIEIDSLSPAAR